MLIGSNIDWAATGAMLQGIGTLVGAIAVIIAAVIGGTTFRAWKKQQVARREIDQAERVLEATYKARRALSGVRHVAMWHHETEAAEKSLKSDERWQNYTAPQRKRLVTAQAYLNRLDRVREERKALDACLPMARALFGGEVEKAIESLNHQFWLVQVDVESYVHDDGKDAEFSAKLHRGMYEAKAPVGGPANEISDNVAVAVATIEARCLPILRT